MSQDHTEGSPEGVTEAADSPAPSDDQAVGGTAPTDHGHQAGRKGLWQRVRGGVVVALVVLFSILLPVTLVVAWSHNVVLNNRGWHRTVDSIAAQPDVTAALAAEITDEIYAALNPQQRIANALPEKAAFLAGPISNGAKGYVEKGVTKVVQSPKFQTLWIRANGFAHEQLVSVLRGNSNAVTTTNGQVVLNLVPLINATLQQIEGFVSGVVGKPVHLPKISSSESPAQACAKIGQAINRDLPPNCGQIPLFPADKLTTAQRFVRFFDRLTLALLILTPVIAAIALFLSRRRRRTLLQLSVGGILGLVVIRRVVFWLQDTLIKAGKPQNRNARSATLRVVLHAPFTISLWIIAGLLVVLAITLITGPYGWAGATRQWLARAWVGVVAFARSLVGRARDDRVMAWIRSHVDLLRVGGVVVALVLFILLSVSWLGFLIITAVVVAYEVWLTRIRRSAEEGPGEGPDLPSETPSTGSVTRV